MIRYDDVMVRMKITAAWIKEQPQLLLLLSMFYPSHKEREKAREEARGGVEGLSEGGCWRGRSSASVFLFGLKGISNAPLRFSKRDVRYSRAYNTND